MGRPSFSHRRTVLSSRLRYAAIAFQESSSVVEKNLLVRNLDGVRIFNNAAANSIQSNVVWRSGRDGIRAEATSSNNTIERNIVVNSVEHDAHDDSVGIGTAGTANFWTDNHCGTENRLVLCDH